MKVKHLLLITGLSATFACLATPANAQTEAKNQIEAGIDKIDAEHQAKISEFFTKVRSLPKEERSTFYKEGYPKPDAAVAALKKIIESAPSDPAVIEAYAWIAQNTRGNGFDAQDYAALTKNHLDNPKLSSFLIPLSKSQNEEALNFVKILSEKSTNKEIRGNALYALAMKIKDDPSKAAEHDALVLKIIEDHSDLTIRGHKVAPALKIERDATMNLAIGKAAPEIIGQDVDGNEMKLSDYKGKVVVLDFWGDW